MTDPLFTGIVPMQITPFRTDGSVDLEGLSAIVEWQAQLGVDQPVGAGDGRGVLQARHRRARGGDLDGRRQPPATCARWSESRRDRPRSPPASAATPHQPAPTACWCCRPTASSRAPTTWSSTTGRSRAASDLPIMAQDGSDEIRAVFPFDVLVRLCREVSAIEYIKVEDVAPGPKITALGEALGDSVTLLCGSGRTGHARGLRPGRGRLHLGGGDRRPLRRLRRGSTTPIAKPPTGDITSSCR